MTTKKKTDPKAATAKPKPAPKKRGGPKGPRTPEMIAAAAAKRAVSPKAALAAIANLAAPAHAVTKRDGTPILDKDGNPKTRRAGQLYGFDWDKIGAPEIGASLKRFVTAAEGTLRALQPQPRGRGRQMPVGAVVQIAEKSLGLYAGYTADTCGEVLEVIHPDKGGPVARVKFDTGDIERVPTARLVIVGAPEPEQHTADANHAAAAN